MNELVEMTHPDLPGQPIRVGRQSVPHHERARWQLADAVDEDLDGDTVEDVDSDPAVDDDSEAGDEPATTAHEGGVSL